jgi:hypothetical protein
MGFPTLSFQFGLFPFFNGGCYWNCHGTRLQWFLRFAFFFFDFRVMWDSPFGPVLLDPRGTNVNMAVPTVAPPAIDGNAIVEKIVDAFVTTLFECASREVFAQVMNADMLNARPKLVEATRAILFRPSPTSEPSPPLRRDAH